MGNHKGNSSGIGTGSHTEDHRELFINPDTTQKTRNKCIHYEYKARFCTALGIGCVGPSNALCIHYNEGNEQTETETTIEANPPFTGIKLIALASVSTGNRSFATPSQEKVDKLIKYYEEHKKIDKPIVVSCKNGKYILEDKYLRYYVAKKLKLQKIYAIMNTPENEFTLKLMKNKQKVKHKIFGVGKIKNIVSDTVEIEFIKTGKAVKFNIDACIKSNVLTLL